MDINIILIVIITIFAVLVYFKKDYPTEGFTGTVEFKNEYNNVASSNNPDELLDNSEKCYGYCGDNKESTHCHIACDDIRKDTMDNLRMEALIFGRFHSNEASLLN